MASNKGKTNAVGSYVPQVLDPRQPIPVAPDPEWILPPQNTLSTPLKSLREFSIEDLEMENWYTAESPYEDNTEGSMELPGFLLQSESKTYLWKRPSEYLSEIVDEEVTTKASKGKANGKAAAAIKIVGPKYAHIKRDTSTISFGRNWSESQLNTFKLWDDEEARILNEKTKQENLRLAREEAIRRREAGEEEDEEEISDSELQDDGDNEPLAHSNIHSDLDEREPGVSDRIISENSITKPSVPDGPEFDSTITSYLRSVQMLLSSSQGLTPCWQLIYPQNDQKLPIFNPGGKYVVKLYVKGKWRKIIVDDKFPFNREGKIQIAHSLYSDELWPSILAKAIYKVFHHFMDISQVTLDPTQELVYAIEALTGLPSQVWRSWPLYETLVNRIVEFDPTHSKQEEVPSPSGNDTSVDTKGATTDCTKEEEDVQRVYTGKHLVILYCTREIQASNFQAISGQTFVIQGIEKDPENQSLKIVLSTDRMKYALTYDELSSYDMNGAVFFTNEAMQYQAQWDIRWKIVQNEDTQDAHCVPCAVPPMYLVVEPTVEDDNEEEGEEAELNITLDTCADQMPFNNDSASVLLLPYSQYPDQQDTEETPSQLKSISMNSISRSITINPSNSSIDTKSKLLVYRLIKSNECSALVTIKANVPVKIQDVADCWEHTLHYSTKTISGEFSLTAEKTWRILFMRCIVFGNSKELSRNADGDDAESNDDDLCLLKYLLDVSSEIAPYFHLYCIDNDNYSVLEDTSHLEGSAKINEKGYTFVGVVHHPHQNLSAGQWRLIVGLPTERQQQRPLCIEEPISIPMQPTAYVGRYCPNKQGCCFRDRLKIPFTESAPFGLALRFSSTDGDAVLRLCLIDPKTNERLLEVSGHGAATAPHIPASTMIESVGKTSKMMEYIVEGSLDTTQWTVPSYLESTRPFYASMSVLEEENAVPEMKHEKHDEEEEVHAEHDPNLISISDHHQLLQWKVDIWCSSTDLTLVPDLSKENLEAEIRHQWEEDEPGREKEALISRLIYLDEWKSAEHLMEEMALSAEAQKELHSLVETRMASPLQEPRCIRPEEHDKDPAIITSVDDFDDMQQEYKQQIKDDIDQWSKYQEHVVEEHAALQEEQDQNVKPRLAHWRSTTLEERKRLQATFFDSE